MGERPPIGSEADATPERALPLTPLRAFEAAARHLSFARAAEELAVSPAAISQHIQTMEIFAGQPLFRRLGRRIELTAAGEAARPLAEEGVRLLIEAARVMRLPLRASRVSIAAPPAFALKWLAPRLSRFQARHADVDVWLSAEAGGVDFAVRDLDLAVRFGPGDYLDASSELLMGERIAPVCAPAFAAELGLKHPSDLSRATLLHDLSARADPSCPDWERWLSAHGAGEVDARHGPRFNDPGLVLEAAASGRGVALAAWRLAAGDLATGRLILPFEAPPSPVRFVYSLVWPRGRTLSPAVRAFMAFLREEASGAEPDYGAGI